ASLRGISWISLPRNRSRPAVRRLGIRVGPSGLSGLPAGAYPRSAKAANFELIRLDAVNEQPAALGLAGQEARPTDSAVFDRAFLSVSLVKGSRCVIEPCHH